MTRIEPEVGHLELGGVEELHGLGDVESKTKGLSQGDDRGLMWIAILVHGLMRSRGWGMEEAKEVAEGHEFADQAETRGSVEDGQNWENVGVIEDAETWELLLEVAGLGGGLREQGLNIGNGTGQKGRQMS